MIKKILPLFIFSMLFFSCNSTLEEPDVNSIDQSALEECDTAACPQVLVDYITYKGDAGKVQAVNDSIHKFVIHCLYLGDPATQPSATKPIDAIAGFIKDYWRDTSEFPDVNEYEAEVSVNENFRSKELISISMSQYRYTGGAHGYSSVSYLNINAKTGEAISNKQLIKDKKALAELAEQKLRADYKISANKGINSTVFWFEDDQFYLSENIGIENNNLVIHYNPYDIASYADGYIDIELPLADVAPFLNYSIENQGS